MNVHPMRRMNDLRRSKRVRKGMFILPSLFTAGNIAAGYFAISQTMQGIAGESFHFDYAAIAIGFAVVFDGLDGRIARMTNTTSEFGKQLDSLADVITFGVAPALLAYMWGCRFMEVPFGNAGMQDKIIKLGAIVTFLFLTAGASRLARFNIQLNAEPSNPGRPGRKYFVGMPIPAGAGIIAAVVHLSGGVPLQNWWLCIVWILLVFAVGYLMVCTWRFYSFKDIDLKRQHPFANFMLLAGMMWAIWAFSGPVLFFIAITYMLSGVLARLSYALRKPAAPTLTPSETESD
ncbi:MAG TPA: phosphatidylcholine/phosphatidylserine synthase [Terriglobales bacterium]|nr:phosphatidylcholine/phosphatidylserine synthase [Terriglobales bacterium]